MALGLPNGIPFCWQPPVKTASDIESSPNLRISADGGVSEFSNGCLDGRAFSLVQASPVGVLPSLLIVPQSYKSGKLYAQLPNARVNHIPNNSMFGASGGVLPSGWTFSVGAASGVSPGYSASGQVTAEDGTLVDYIDFTFSGTATASGFLNLRPNASPSTIASVSGQSWNAPVYLQLISGSAASISPTYQLQETTSGGTFIDGSNITGLGSLTTSLPLRRYNVTRDLNTSGTVVTCCWGHSIVSGTTYSYTIRIGSPQLENLSFPTSVIRTVSGAVYAPYSGAAPGGSTIASIADFTVSRNTTATRVDSSGLIASVASGVPRIDWLGQSCPALLVEASGQNQALWSRDLSVSGTWAASGITAVRNAVGADGAASGATTLTATAASATILQNISHASQSRIFSAYMRRVSGTGQIQLTTNGGTNWQDVTLTSSFAPFNSGAQTVASGQVGIRMIASGDVIEVDFTQAELGPVATSPIPTTTAPVTRNADDISASGALVSGLIGQTEGTIYAEVDVTNRLNGTAVITLAKDSSTTNRLLIYTNTNNRWRANYANASGTIVDNTSANDAQVLGINKLALAYGAGGDATLHCNGSLIITLAGTSTFTQELRAIFLGRINTSPFLYFNNRIRAAALYTTRLSNDQLAELTRL